ncbi:hypothetical protein BN946_scf184980.g51 [Trametes cinnabarina]|uniref:Uncharacterized protein n=1 Tax=Pycnoporus cinnabarinus TaxID=5643 RepID=A0A060SDQ9_PYCCI|nr:hypothetical protein BN946_scf184980.g51 [Trametes cinnabarina]
MQSYSHPDVFFCPLYNPPGVSDPLASILSGETEEWPASTFSSPTTSRSASPFSVPSSPAYSTPPTSRENSLSPPTSPSPLPATPSSPSAHSEGSKKLQRYRRMCAKSGKPLLDFVAEVEGRRIVHEKRRQMKHSQTPRKSSSPLRPGSDRH